MLRRTRAFVIAAIAGVLAYSAEAAIYSSFIVPRLPAWQSVPLYWWVLEFSPVAFLLVAIAVLAPNVRNVVAWTSAAFLPWHLVCALYAAILGRPVGHDLWVTNSPYWASVALVYGFAIGVALISFGAISVTRRLL